MALDIEQRAAVAEDGERFSLLLAGTPRQPLFRPTVFTIAMRRSAGLAASTLLRDDGALIHLLIWADLQRIDLEDRFARGEFLTPKEVQSFARATKLSLRQLRSTTATSARSLSLSTGTERFRSPSVPSKSGVRSSTSGYKLWLAGKYLDWLAGDTAPPLVHAGSASDRSASKRIMLDAIEGQLTKFNGPAHTPREGLTEAQQELLRKVIDPSSPSNPWLHPFVKVRNQSIIEFMLTKGTRRGEALKQAISDIDFTSHVIAVVRRPDDPNDSRAREPNVKRAGRVLPMAEPLADLLIEYIVSWRSTIPAARRHDILFVSKDGDPLSKESVQKIFKTLRRKVPGFPKRLVAHLLRHTWNDNFSMHMDANHVSPQHEVRDRSYLMGWSEHSGSAARYTTRSTRKRANAHSLKMQEANAPKVKK